MVDIKTSKEFADDFVLLQQDKHNNPDKYRGYSFPIPWLMLRTGGFGHDWYTIITGQAKSGKTSVLSTAAAHMGAKGESFLWVGIEETLNLVATRIFANIAQISRIKFRDIKLEKTDWPDLFKAAGDIGDFNAWWCYGAKTPKEITELLKKYQPRILFIDYIQLMKQDGYRSKTEEISACSKFLLDVSNGAFTKETVSVIAAAQENDDRTPLWCKDLLRDCDLAIGIREIDNGAGGTLPGKRRLSIDIFRHGEPDATDVGFIGERSIVCEYITKPIDPPPGLKI